MRKIKCAEVWGGNKNVNMETSTSTLLTSIYSSSAQGGEGGDFYYYSVCGSDKLSRIILGDVVGHGDEVSHISEWVYREMADHANTLVGNDILVKLNERITQRGLEAMSTAAVAGYYLNDGILRFSYAGHHPVYIRRAGEEKWWPAELEKLENGANLPLGIRDNTNYYQHELKLNSGDALFMYTDGVLEAQNQEKKLLGTLGLLKVLNQVENNDPTLIKNTVLGHLDEFTNGITQHDDVSMIAIKIH